MSTQGEPDKTQCSLLLMVATPTEEEELLKEVQERKLPVELVRKRDSAIKEDYHWFGRIGNETVIAMRPARTGGRVVMGSIGTLGSAARAIRLRNLTGAQGIVQLGMAFGIDRATQKAG